MARILVIDDDETFSYVLKRACSRQGHEVMLSASACEAKEASAGMFDIVFLDISLPDGNGLSLLPLLLGSEGHPEVIVITGHDNRDWLEQALMAGAWDFIRKDDSLDTVFAALEQALLYHQNRCGAQLSSSGQRTTPLKRNRLVGSGAAIGRCLESVIQCADSDVCVLLSGETGTGKEVSREPSTKTAAAKTVPSSSWTVRPFPRTLPKACCSGMYAAPSPVRLHVKTA